ncbi:MAG: TAXI family TRAP transporter solute-binding subunit [Acidobacteriota bacterium]
MPRRILFLSFATLLALLLTLAGCGGDGDTNATGDSSGGDSNERRFLSVGTAPPGGTFFVVGGALAETLDQSGGASWRVTAEATKGTQENIRRLDRGELDLALANAAISYFAVRGEAAWEKPFEIRSLMTLAPNVALFVTPADSGVQTIADLAGRRVVIGPAGAGFEHFVNPILAAHDLTQDDLTPLSATQSGAVDLLTDGAADAAFLGGGVPTPSITQLSASREVRFLPFAPEIRQRLVTDYPFFAPATIAAGTYRGQTEAFEGLNVGSMHLIAAADLDEETAYRIVKTLWENRERVVERHAAGRAIRPEIVVRDVGTPFHPGAERYFREIGIWPEPSTGDSESEDPPTGES